MGKVKQLLYNSFINDDPISNHLEKEMYEESEKLKKQITAIKLILEECK